MTILLPNPEADQAEIAELKARINTVLDLIDGTTGTSFCLSLQTIRNVLDPPKSHLETALEKMKEWQGRGDTLFDNEIHLTDEELEAVIEALEAK